MAQNWAILIGINQYSYLEDLKYAKADAEAMFAWLKQEAEFKRLFLFTENSKPIPANLPIPSQPTFGHLDTFFDVQFDRKLLSSADNLWFFFSGHGLRTEEGDYLMLSDSNPRRVGKTALSVNYVTERLRNWGTGNVVIFLDACRNEAKGSRGNLIDTRDYQGIISFYSCSARERAYEIETLQQGSFTHILLEALRQGKQESFTVDKLEQYLMKQVPRLNNHYGKPSQRPLARVEPIGRRSLILFGESREEDINQLKLAAYKEKNREVKERLWTQVNIAVKGRDEEALLALTGIVITEQERHLLNHTQSGSKISEEQLQDEISKLKLAAFKAQSQQNVELARELWIKLNILAKGLDTTALDELNKIAKNGNIPILPFEDEEDKLEPDFKYTELHNLLQERRWREADEKTVRIMLEITDRKQSGWLRSQDIEQIPCSDLHTIDQLWTRYSGRRFGFSVQREIWLAVGGQPGQFQGTIFYNFGDRVGWRVNNEWLETYNNFNFNMNAPQGHLPSFTFPGENDQVDLGLWRDSFGTFLTRWETCLSRQGNV